MVKPSDEEFKACIESTLNSHDVLPVSWDGLNTLVTVPVLDKQTSDWETEREARSIKANKACGPDGLALGIFKLLPGPWLLLLTTIFNSIFSRGVYPAACISFLFHL